MAIVFVGASIVLMEQSNKSKKTLSRKHHYLPRHYLEGFTNVRGSFFIYDKQEDKILGKPLTPAASFFEKNLNTITLPDGQKSDFLEDVYTSIENQAWGPFDRIRDSNHTTKIQLFDKMHLHYFLYVMYWRLPANIKYVNDLSETVSTTKDKVGFLSLKNENGSKVDEKVAKVIREFPGFRKAMKLSLPFAKFYQKNWSQNFGNWRFLYTSDKEQWYMVGDNPIITSGVYDSDPNKCLDEFVLPISGRIMLINSQRIPSIQLLSPHYVISINTAIIHKAQRFVACHNRSFLEAIVSRYRLYKEYGKQSQITEELFR